MIFTIVIRLVDGTEETLQLIAASRYHAEQLALAEAEKIQERRGLVPQP